VAEIEIHRHAYQSGVFAKRAAGKDLRAAASPALTQGRFTDPAIELAGTVGDVMSVSMLNIFLAAGFWPASRR